SAIRYIVSAVSAEYVLYAHLIRTLQLLDHNRFKAVLDCIANSSYEIEPAFQFLQREASAALDLFDILETLPSQVADSTDLHNPEVLCVTHASVPDQTGGYAIRAHGILRSLQPHGVKL